MPIGALRLRQVRSTPTLDNTRIDAYFASNPNATDRDRIKDGWFAQNASKYPNMGLVHEAYTRDSKATTDMAPALGHL